MCSLLKAMNTLERVAKTVAMPKFDFVALSTLRFFFFSLFVPAFLQLDYKKEKERSNFPLDRITSLYFKFVFFFFFFILSALHSIFFFPLYSIEIDRASREFCETSSVVIDSL